MSRADYAHHNEDADRIWWEEEGRHGHDGVPSACKWCGMIPDEFHFQECEGPPDDEEEEEQ